MLYFIINILGLTLIKNNEDIFFNKEKLFYKNLEKRDKIKNLSLGEYYSGVVMEDQQGNDHLYMWGRNNYGQLGNDSTSNKHYPIEINENGWDSYGTQIKIKNLSLGERHSGAVIEDQQGNDHLYMWGGNETGQLGNDSTKEQHYPIEINENGWDSYGTQIKIKNLSLGGINSGAVIEDQQGNDHLYMWGYNGYGQLGNDSTSNKHYPIEINENGWDSYGTQIKIKNLSLGKYHSGAVIEDQQGNDHLYMWGHNNYGQLGNDSIKEQHYPIEINENGWDSYGTQIKIKNLSLGKYFSGHSGSVIEDQQGNDHLYMWGNNTYGQLGNDSTKEQHYPIEINENGWDSYGTQIKIKNLSLGEYYSGVVMEDQQGNDHLYMWGRNNYGQLGNDSTKEQHYLIEINENGWDSYGTQIKIKNLSLGEYHSGAVIEDQQGNDHLYMWGGNETYGQLGNDSTENQHYPIEITPGLIISSFSIEEESLVTLSWNLIQNNSSIKLNSLILTGTGVNESNKVELETKFGENEYTINLDFGNYYDDWEITYLTNFGWGNIKIDSFDIIENPKGDIDIINKDKPYFLLKGEAKFIVDTSKLEGTTKIKDNQIMVSGNNISEQTLVLNYEHKNNYSFIIKELQSNENYILNANYTLITDSSLEENYLTKGKELKFHTPEQQLSSITNLKIDSLDYYNVNLSWDKLIESENIMYSFVVYDNKNKEIRRNETSENYITINNLNYNTKYNFEIYAHNDGSFWISKSININFKTKDLYWYLNYLILILILFTLINILILVNLLIKAKKYFWD